MGTVAILFLHFLATRKKTLDTNRYLVPQDVVLIYPKNEFVDENTLYLWLSYFNSIMFQVLMMGGRDSGEGGVVVVVLVVI